MLEDLVAIYPDPHSASRALNALRREDVPHAQIASAAPVPVVGGGEHRGGSSKLGWIALVGALTGLGCAIALQVATSESLGLVVGGKPIVSWIAFGVVMFELTMLFAGATNFVALVGLCALARRRVSRKAREQVRGDRVVLVVPAGHFQEDRRAAIRALLQSTAAEVLG